MPNSPTKPAALKVGDKFEDEYGRITLMAIANSWAMLRRPHCMPFCVPVRELIASKNYKKVPK